MFVASLRDSTVLQVLLVAAVVVPAARAEAEPSPKAYYGLLHAHTRYSDGLGTPAEAYRKAKSAGLDFFAVTPHNHKKAEGMAKDRKDGVLIATNTDLYNAEDTVTFQPDGEELMQALSVIAAARRATDDTFVALYGQEFSTISTGNHVNVFEIDDVITVENGDFRGLFESLAQTAASGTRPLVQLNHPNVQQDLFYNGSNSETRRKMNNDYGIDNGDLGPEFADLVAVADPYVGLVEILSGPAMKEKRQRTFHYGARVNDYYFYLTQGFHVSPSAGQDNHYKTWGTATDARTGVLCDSLSRANLLRSMLEQRTFATEDKNLDLRLRIDGRGLGSVLERAAQADLAIEVEIKDENEPTAEYDVVLYYGTVEPEHRDAATYWKAADGFEEEFATTGNGVLPIVGYVASGYPEFFYVKVTQDDGDRAWSAPVWINHPRPQPIQGRFAWADGRMVYHFSECRYARSIKNNKRWSGNPPDGLRPCKRCLPPDDDEEGH